MHRHWSLALVPLLERPSMQDFHSQWLNGNSLVMAASSLDAEQVDDLLDIQLVAYLKACGEYARAAEPRQWGEAYCNTHVALGCVPVALQQRSIALDPASSCTPLQLIADELKEQVDPALWHGINSTLEVSERRLGPVGEQRLWAESYEPAIASLPGRMLVQVRVLLPGPVVASCELGFASDKPLGDGWLWQPFGLHRVSAVTSQSTRYQVNESLIDSLRSSLRDVASTSRQRYLWELPPLGQGHTHHD